MPSAPIRVARLLRFGLGINLYGKLTTKLHFERQLLYNMKGK